MKNEDRAFELYMDSKMPGWKRHLNGPVYTYVREAFAAGAEAERKEVTPTTTTMEIEQCQDESKNASAVTPSAKTGMSTRKPRSKASSSRKVRRGK